MRSPTTPVIYGYATKKMSVSDLLLELFVFGIQIVELIGFDLFHFSDFLFVVILLRPKTRLNLVAGLFHFVPQNFLLLAPVVHQRLINQHDFAKLSLYLQTEAIIYWLSFSARDELRYLVNENDAVISCGHQIFAIDRG
jgi:hypothetical protein